MHESIKVPAVSYQLSAFSLAVLAATNVHLEMFRLLLVILLPNNAVKADS